MDSVERLEGQFLPGLAAVTLLHLVHVIEVSELTEQSDK